MTPIRPCYFCNFRADTLTSSGTPICIQCADIHDINLTPEESSDPGTFDDDEDTGATRMLGPDRSVPRYVGADWFFKAEKFPLFPIDDKTYTYRMEDYKPNPSTVPPIPYGLSPEEIDKTKLGTVTKIKLVTSVDTINEDVPPGVKTVTIPIYKRCTLNRVYFTVQTDQGVFDFVKSWSTLSSNSCFMVAHPGDTVDIPCDFVWLVS